MYSIILKTLPILNCSTGVFSVDSNKMISNSKSVFHVGAEHFFFFSNV